MFSHSRYIVTVQYGKSSELDFIHFDVDYQDRITLLTISRPLEPQTLVNAMDLMAEHKTDPSAYRVITPRQTLSLSAFNSDTRSWILIKPSPEFPLVDQAEKPETEVPY